MTQAIPELSVIMAVYNVEPYLRQSLNSLVGQSLDPAWYEIILVDDKSTDGSLAICREYAAEHGNIHLVELPENTPGGVGIPANIGLKQARGKYIGFLDGDDYAEPDMFRKLLSFALHREADLALCSFRMLDQGTQAVIPSYDLQYWNLLFSHAFGDLDEVSQKSVYLRLSPVPWRKIYKRAWLEKEGLAFPEGDYFCEDTAWHWMTTILARETVQVNEELVTHRVGRAGQTTAPNLAERTPDMLEQLLLIKDFLEKRNLQSTYAEIFESYMLFVLYSCREQLSANADKVRALVGQVDVDALFKD